MVFCGFVGMLLGLVQWGLVPWLRPGGQFVVSAVDTVLALQAIGLLLITISGGFRPGLVWRRISLGVSMYEKVRNPFRPMLRALSS